MDVTTNKGNKMQNKTVTQVMTSQETIKTLTAGFPDTAPSAKMIAFMKSKKRR